MSCWGRKGVTIDDGNQLLRNPADAAAKAGPARWLAVGRLM